MRVEWRCACRDSGGQCAVTPGIPEMQLLPADSLVSTQRVRGYTDYPNAFCHVSSKLMKVSKINFTILIVNISQNDKYPFLSERQ